MKKILLLLLISISGYSQTLLKLKAIEYAPGSNYCTVTNSLGVQTYTPCSSLTNTIGLLPSTTSITINGTTKSFTSTPSFSVGLSNVLPYGNTTGTNNIVVSSNQNIQGGTGQIDFYNQTGVALTSDNGSYGTPYIWTDNSGSPLSLIHI
jgi:hypothetical protein